MKTAIRILTAVLLLSTLALAQAQAQAPAVPARNMMMGPRIPQYISPEVLPDRKVVFRVYAPESKTVKLVSSDLPGLVSWGPIQSAKGLMQKAENGVWEVTVGPFDPGTYRYALSVDGVVVVDPKNTATSEAVGNVWSMVYIPGSDFADTKDVPHGAVGSITYYSKVLGKFRRMHIYTPPGYEKGAEKYPTLYLLHGAGDCDDSWWTVGRAGIIMDNLIAAGKAKPMVIVMPAGHTASFDMMAMASGPRRGPNFMDDFVKDFENEIMPYTESHYRVLTDRNNRAIAGLSMGGAHTLNIVIPHAEKFAYVGVFSSGVFGLVSGPMMPPQTGPTFEEQNKAALNNAAVNKGIKLFWFATGKEDFVMPTTRATVEMLKKHAYNSVFLVTEGGHTWTNWRDYLSKFAPQLFR